ncbi:MAG: HNH endonuclease [Candidatus Dojkabacteria bacterium]|nr:HNH endonuclease [Candidatus Dojkabacteria bacterium]
MNYEKIYYSIINHRKANPVPKDQYKELHHILPRSLGGKNNKDNLVYLTPKEHFICHLLLTKMFNEQEKREKMIKAFFAMKHWKNGYQNRYTPKSINSRIYEKLKKEFAEIQSKKQKGERNSQYGKVWITKDDMSIKINKNSLKEYLERGWIIGRKNKQFSSKMSKAKKIFYKDFKKRNDILFISKKKIKIFLLGNILDVEERHYWLDYMFEGWVMLKKFSKNDRKARIYNLHSKKNITIHEEDLNLFLNSKKWERGIFKKNG